MEVVRFHFPLNLKMHLTKTMIFSFIQQPEVGGETNCLISDTQLLICNSIPQLDYTAPYGLNYSLVTLTYTKPLSTF